MAIVTVWIITTPGIRYRFHLHNKNQEDAVLLLSQYKAGGGVVGVPEQTPGEETPSESSHAHFLKEPSVCVAARTGDVRLNGPRSESDTVRDTCTCTEQLFRQI